MVGVPLEQSKYAVQELICQRRSKSHCGGVKVVSSGAGSCWICGECVVWNVAEDGAPPRRVRTGWGHGGVGFALAVLETETVDVHLEDADVVGDTGRAERR
jgi:hypothetical protein